MAKRVHLNLVPEEAADERSVRKLACKAAGLDPPGDIEVRIIKKSVDARKPKIMINLDVEIYQPDEPSPSVISPFKPQNVTNSREVIIVGAGPAGLFAALKLIEAGLRPVILERGRDVALRKRDIARISRKQKVNPDSNYCFGEGGAGTFSDGKLYTRSKKRGDNYRVLELFCHHGADPGIMYESHPHLGTDRLPGIITGIRHSVLDAGGIIMFEKKVTDFIVNGSSIAGVVVSEGERYSSGDVILATGHSARDIYEICSRRNISLEMKMFAMGVRVEHPQELIDHIQYHGRPRGEFLPPAAYSLARQVDGRGVYSFCMCPGGFIVPSATSQEEIVVNGMSPSRRNSPYANSGIVVEIKPEDLLKYANCGPLAGLRFQQDLEKEAWLNGDMTQRAPAQRVTDFIDGLQSCSLPKVSYFPGVVSSSLHRWLPGSLADRLRKGLQAFGKSMKGYITSEAVILGVESRTSSPVRIPRKPDKYEHISLSGLYPCGEGSGYSGGIVSSAVDGIKVAEAIAARYKAC